MKKLSNISILFLLLAGLTGAMISCEKFPVDEDGLLITERGECYVSNFQLLDADYQSTLLGNAWIDTTAQVVVAYVRYGTDLTHVKPQVSLCEDAKLDPKITGWTDFSGSKMSFPYVDGDWTAAGIPNEQLGVRVVETGDFPSSALKYTVIAGDRVIKKTYTFVILERPLQ
ncbi:MAG: hypothetical protein IJ654_06660 [Bacteroidales bacterium]|nr:hypothetical protein [Bacteroidales bacterium]